MSMLDAFFSKGFKGAKCKTLLKLTIPRIKLLRNRREVQLKQMRRDIAKLLENGQEATALIRVEHIIREENMMAAQEIIELFCELIAVRLPIIETQRECPLDLKEAISSICFAAPRCSDLPELQQVQVLFAAKYGKEFVTAAMELMPDCGVNRQIIDLLSVRAPPAEAKLKLLKEIAEEHELNWDPAASESEFFEPREDLLNGANHLIPESVVPFLQGKHDESFSSNMVKESSEQTDKDVKADSLDLPEVHRVVAQASSDVPFSLETVPLRPAPPDYSKPDHEVAKLTTLGKDTPHNIYKQPEELDKLDPSLSSPYAPSNVSLPTDKNKQFIPFVSYLSMTSSSVPIKQSKVPPSLPQNKIEDDLDSVSPSSLLFTAKQIEPSPYSQTRGEANVDLQDVLSAAQAAAETAERAAAAARAAASLAQVRITELVTKRTSQISGGSVNEFQGEYPIHLDTTEKSKLGRPSSFGHVDSISDYEPTWISGSPTLASNGVHKMGVESPDNDASEHLSSYQPQRLTSLEDDPYFSYPNLFTSQDSSFK